MALTSRCTSGDHEEHDVYAAQCPGREVLAVLANKWTALTIGVLTGGPHRFGELQRRLEGVSPKVLTQTLRRLEDYGFLTRTVYPTVPVRVDYELTALGLGAAAPLAQLRDWVEANVDLIPGGQWGKPFETSVRPTDSRLPS